MLDRCAVIFLSPPLPLDLGLTHTYCACLAIASCRYVTSVVNGCDAIPMMSSVSADVLREEVMASEWYDEFHRDMRQYKIFRAFESTKRWVRTKQSALPNVASLRGCGLEQGELMARIRGFLDRVTIKWSEQSTPRSTRSDAADGAKHDVHEPRREEGVEDGRDGTGGEDLDSSFARHYQDTASESLEAEASWRRKAVHDAVLDAEAAERADQERCSGVGGRHGHRHGRADRESEAHVPSIIRPGNYGGQRDESRNTPSSSPSSSSRREGCWRRSMYPAGRIMHFVPAHVVPGFVMNRLLLVAPLVAPHCPPPSSHARSIDSSRYEDSIVEDEEPFVDSPVDDADDVRDSIGPDADRSGVLSASRTAPHARQASELGFEEIMGGEGAVLHVRTVSESGPLPALKAAPGPPPKNMVLVDNVPQRLYGRMRCVLCSATLYICTSRVTCRSFSLPLLTPHPASRIPHPSLAAVSLTRCALFAGQAVDDYSVRSRHSQLCAEFALVPSAASVLIFFAFTSIVRDVHIQSSRCLKPALSIFAAWMTAPSLLSIFWTACGSPHRPLTTMTMPAASGKDSVTLSSTG